MRVSFRCVPKNARLWFAGFRPSCDDSLQQERSAHEYGARIQTRKKVAGIWFSMSDEKQTRGHRESGFAIQTAIRYRVRGEHNWHDGVTETISGSSVLFRGETMIEPNTMLELTFNLPVKLPGDAGGKVMCSGVTVASDNSSMISVRFSRLRLLRP